LPTEPHDIINAPANGYGFDINYFTDHLKVHKITP
jgi:hypothetical protein